MAAGDCHIFPFFVDRNAKYDARTDLSADRIIIRGMVCIKKEFNFDVPLYNNGRLVGEKIYYWHPITAQSNMLEKGVSLVKEGLGFKTKPIRKTATLNFKKGLFKRP